MTMGGLAYEKLEKLKCFVLPGNRPDSEVVNYYNSAYSFWRQIWLRTMNEVDHRSLIYSDDFTRQDQFSALFDGSTVVGLFFYSWFDLTLESNWDHSYFKHYPPTILSEISCAGRVMTMGYLSVHPEWRKTVIGFSISDLLMGLATRTFLESHARALITFTRNDRKTNELCYRFGGNALLKKHTVYNIDSDIIIFDKKTVIDSTDPDTSHFIEYLWNTRVDATRPKGLKFHMPFNSELISSGL